VIGGETARRYAKALVEIAEGRGVLDETGAELAELAQAVAGNDELRRILMNPRFPRPTRVRVLEGLLVAAGGSDLLRGFARLVAEKDRIAHLPGIADAYRRLADERRVRVRAQVRTAYDLDPSAVEQLRERLGRMTGREVLLEVETDESLIGGLVCRVGGVVMDGSIRNQLKNLRDALRSH